MPRLKRKPEKPTDPRQEQDIQFYKPGQPIPADHQVIALSTLVQHFHNPNFAGGPIPYGREIQKGQVVDDRDPIVRANPQWFRRYGPTLDREEASSG